jgi:cbb3-type cytochrome oxidase subunit 1
MKNVDVLFITVAVVYAVLGMAIGIVIGIGHAFDYRDVHAHINLVGWVTLAIFGLVYRAYPAMRESPLTKVHFWVANLGAVIFIPGIFIVITTESYPMVIVGSLLTLASMAIFLVNFMRHRGG